MDKIFEHFTKNIHRQQAHNYITDVTLSIIRKMQIKRTMRYHYTPSRMAQVNSNNNNN